MLEEKLEILKLNGRILVDFVFGSFMGAMTIVIFLGETMINFFPPILAAKLMGGNDLFDVEKDTKEFFNISHFYFEDMINSIEDIKTIKKDIQAEKEEKQQLSIKTKPIKKKVKKDIINYAETLINKTNIFSTKEQKVIILKIKEVLLSHTNEELTMKKLNVIEDAINEIIESKKKNSSVLDEAQLLSMITPTEEKIKQYEKKKQKRL